MDRDVWDLVYNDKQLLKLATKAVLRNKAFSKAYAAKKRNEEDEEIFFLNAKPQPHFLQELLEKYEHDLNKLSELIKINIRLYDVIPEKSPLKNNAAILAAALHHRPDWYSKMKLEDGECKIAFTNKMVEKDEKPLYHHLKSSPDLVYIYEKLAQDEDYQSTSIMIGALNIFGDQDYHHETLYIRGRAYDLERHIYVGEDLQYTKRPIVEGNQDSGLKEELDSE